MAKAGYAVGGIRVRAGSNVNSFQLVFFRVKGERLDPSDSHLSAWVGDEGGKRLPDVTSEGDPVVGIEGEYSSQLVSLRLLQVMSLPSPGQSLAPFNGPKVGSDSAGLARGSTFEEVAPRGGLLVGLRIFQGSSWGSSVRAVQPIYQVGDKYVLGKRHGGRGGSARQLIARPGYAVGGVWVQHGIVVDSLKIAYYRVGGRRLIMKDAYASDQVGGDGGRSLALDGRGQPVVGIFGSYDDDLNSFGIQALRKAD